MKLTVATCQFPVDSDMRRNLQYVSRQIRAARDRGAHVAHFPEACLSGYARVDFPSLNGFDWDLLHECTQQIIDLARQCRLWVILGSTHRLTGRHKPHNSLYIINSYHAAHIPPTRFQAMQDTVGRRLHPLNPGSTLPGITMPATMIAAAANNHMWISCPNSCARESCFPSFFVRPDGVITGRLRRHTAGILVSEVNPDAHFYESAVAWRDRAMRGTLHSGRLVRDLRSDERTQI
jgi:predicted amidohydrolase